MKKFLTLLLLVSVTASCHAQQTIPTTPYTRDLLRSTNSTAARTKLGITAGAFPLLAPDGSAGAPSYSFTLDADTGIYRNGPNTVGISADGTPTLSITKAGSTSHTNLSLTGGVKLRGGSITETDPANPVIQFVNDADTGIYRPGANEFGIAVGGSNIVTFAAASVVKGNLLVGNGTNLVNVGVGSNNQFLTADSTQASGVKWGDGLVFPLLAPTGGNPPYSFTGDSDSGIYWNGPNAVGIAAGGSNIVTFSAASVVKGNLLVGNGTNLINVGVGSNNQFLTADSTQASGVKWGPATNVWPLLADVGSAGAPSYSFSGDSDTGIYRLGLNTVGLSGGGVIAFSVGNAGSTAHTNLALTGGIQLRGGSISETDPANPVIQFVNDLDTGIFRPAGNTLGFAAGAQKVMTITTNEASLNYPTNVYLGGRLFTATNDATVANTTTETTILGSGVGTKTIPANFLAVGKTLKVTARGKVSWINNLETPSVSLRCKLGGTTVATAGIPVVGEGPELSNDWFKAEFVIVCRATGASGSVVAHGELVYHNPGEGSHIIVYVAPAVGNSSTINTTTSQAIDLTWEWGAADAGNTVTAQIASIEVIN